MWSIIALYNFFYFLLIVSARCNNSIASSCPVRILYNSFWFFVICQPCSRSAFRQIASSGENVFIIRNDDNDDNDLGGHYRQVNIH